jgi:integrase
VGKLTATRIKSTRAAGRYGDGNGLFLVVGKGSAASWVVRIQKDGRRRDFGLGSAAKVSLSAARTLAEKLRSQVAAGVDPIAERQKARGVPTFREAAEQVHAEHKRNWRNGKHNAQWLSSLEAYAFPKIGDLPVSKVEGGAVRDLLAEIWLEKPETARRVRQRIGAILDWAFSKGYRDAEAPMRSICKGLPKHATKSRHLAAMAFNDVPAFMARLRERESWGRLALEAAILTAARSGEIRGATWDEIDLEAGLWTIPASRMKAGREHVVPLSPAAKQVFARASDLRTEGSRFVFQGAKRDKSMSDMTLLKALRSMGEPFTVHGFRSSFRDWVSEETSFPGELAEAALAHIIENKVEAAYRRGNLLAKRRKLMDAWGEYCSGKGENVLRLVVAK